MKKKILEWAAGIDSEKKDVAKVASEAVVRLLDLSSRLIFQIPHQKDHPIVRGIKCVAMIDSVYKCLIKAKDDDEDDKEKDETEDKGEPEEVAPEQRVLLLPESSHD